LTAPLGSLAPRYCPIRAVQAPPRPRGIWNIRGIYCYYSHTATVTVIYSTLYTVTTVLCIHRPLYYTDGL
jgi:hypothetical protein